MLTLFVRSRRPRAAQAFPSHVSSGLDRMPLIEAISMWLRETLLPYGGPGLMVLAIGDSSFVSLPEVNDLLLMTFSMNNPGKMMEMAALTTLGSLIGCLLLYSVGVKGGE